MNDNYIAPEALDENHIVTCNRCAIRFNTIEKKIEFYRGRCPSCGNNPSFSVGFRANTARRPSYSGFNLDFIPEIPSQMPSADLHMPSADLHGNHHMPSAGIHTHIGWNAPHNTSWSYGTALHDPGDDPGQEDTVADGSSSVTSPI